MYKGKPLVRSGNTLYYGDMSDPYVILMQIASTQPGYDMDMAQKSPFSFYATDTNLRPKERIFVKAKRLGFTSLGHWKYLVGSCSF